MYCTGRLDGVRCIVQLDDVESIVLSDVPCTVRLDDAQCIV